MGLNIGLNAITSGGLTIALVFLIIMGILLVSAANKVKAIPEFSQSSGLQNGYNKLKTAYILTFVAAGVALLLAILYGGHDIWWSPTEWIHSVIFLIIIALMLVATVYAYTVLYDLYTPELQDRNGADSFIWSALLFSILAFMIILTMATGRVGYNAARTGVRNRYNELERKVHQTHANLTGEPVNYDLIGAEDPSRRSSDCLPVQIPAQVSNQLPNQVIYSSPVQSLQNQSPGQMIYSSVQSPVYSSQALPMQSPVYSSGQLPIQSQVYSSQPCN